MPEETMVCESSLERVARVIEAIDRLPAVAALDWADRAARALGHLASPARACLVIVTLDAHGSVVHHEATGVATSVQAQPGVARGDGGDESSAELTLRSRSERLDQTGVRATSDMLAAGVYDVLDRLMQTPDWRSRGLGKLWVGVPAGEVLTGIHVVSGSDPWRVLIAMVGAGASTSDAARRIRIAQMRVVMPRLARRAALALGLRRTSSGSWLTGREQQVLEQLTLGRSVREIAEEIGRSPHTVHDHVKSLHRKLAASSRGELVARALGYLDGQGHQDQADPVEPHEPALTEVKAGIAVTRLTARPESAVDPLTRARVE